MVRDDPTSGTLTIAVTMGDPYGIGPEIIVKALADPARRSRASYRIYGIESCLADAARRAGIAPFWVTRPHEPPGSAQARATSNPTGPNSVTILDWGMQLPPLMGADRETDLAAALLAGTTSLDFCERAIRDARQTLKAGGGVSSSQVHAIATAPICKAHWSLASRGKWAGHTELFGARFGANRYRMMFVSPAFRVVLHTVHMPLRAVAASLRSHEITETIRLAAAACRDFGVTNPRIAVCGIDPHAGEHGVIGMDDERFVAPGVEAAAAEGLLASGPHSADTLFNRARLDLAGDAEFDCVVALYHDQGLIPVKLLNWDSAVNLTIGIPVPRTSPDHGTAFDIAGQNRADAGSMGAAIDRAVELAGRRRGG